MRQIVLALALALALAVVASLGACATQVTLPPLPDCHPANPDAPSASRASPAPLDSTADDMGTVDHGAMDHGTMTHEAMEPDHETVYACPMHPEVRADEPGTCPVCGMALQPVDEEPPTSPGVGR